MVSFLWQDKNDPYVKNSSLDLWLLVSGYLIALTYPKRSDVKDTCSLLTDHNSSHSTLIMILHNLCCLLEKALALRLRSTALILLGNVEGGPQLKTDIRQEVLIPNFQLNLPDTWLVSWYPTLGSGDTSHRICSENGVVPCFMSPRDSAFAAQEFFSCQRGERKGKRHSPSFKINYLNKFVIARMEYIDGYVEQMNYELSDQKIYFTVICNRG